MEELVNTSSTNASMLPQPFQPKKLFLGFLALIPIASIIGNVLVIVAILTQKSLQQVQNHLLISLAVADLFVSITVMPLAIVNDILDFWIFGFIVCDIWRTCDVMCCTASILSLCVIALDRYFAITQPVEYATRRNRRLMSISILLVWCLSFVISLPPVTVWYGAGHGSDNLRCALIQDKVYIIYSALGSFYVPLAVMIVLYIGIYKVASTRLKLQVQRQKVRKQSLALISAVNIPILPQEVKCNDVNLRSTTTQEHQYRRKTCKDLSNCHKNSQKKSSTENNSSVKLAPSLELLDVVGSSGPLSSYASEHTSSVSMQKSTEERLKEEEEVKSFLLPAANGSKLESDSGNIPSPNSHIPADTCKTRTNGIFKKKQSFEVKVKFPDENMTRGNSEVDEQVEEGSEPKLQGLVSMLPRNSIALPLRAIKINFNREHRAAKILGIILGCFMLCWLPFFLLYIILPFCHPCGTPPKWLLTLFTWLGYVNSALNPIIYTIFNEDFKNAFRRMLTFPKT